MKQLHSPFNNRKSKEGLLGSSLLTSFIVIMCCVICFTGITWAWFTSNASVATTEIVSATYDTEFVVSDGENEIQPVEGVYTLDPTVTYTVTVTAFGTATTGFASVSLDGQKYYSVQLAPGESVSFIISGFETMTGESSWGTSSATDPVENLDEIYKYNKISFYAYGDDSSVEPIEGKSEAVLITENEEPANTPIAAPEAPEYDGYVFIGWKYQDGSVYHETDTFIKDTVLTAVYRKGLPVKLVPADENSPVMIERDGVVETWNTLAEGTTINGVTSVIEPNANAYEAPEDFETYYVYGLEKGLTAEKLANYVKVQGDGSYTVELSETESYGTGAVIKVKDNVTDSIVEEFYIVIFGDINGDAAVTVTDFMNINKELSASEPTWSASQGGVGYLKKAGDLNGDGAITVTDFMKMNAVLSDKNVIDQKVGQAI